ncbi:MAG: flagellin lysine-N-methylase [Lachnospiraceae bacterium]
MQMRYRVPDYYQQFVCLAGACPNTCCAGWQIEIDEESLIKYIKYQKSGQPFGNRLFNGIDWKEGSFRQDSKKRCEFLNQENLCEIYSEAGKHMLCGTCRTYPRHIEEFEGIWEISLALSCPEAARIILEKADRVTFSEEEKNRAEDRYQTFDEDLFSELIETRQYLFEIIQNRNIPMNDRIANILLYVHNGTQNASNQSGYFLLQQIWQLFRTELEVLNDTWPDYLDKCMKILYDDGEERYLESKRNFRINYRDWEIECEQLLIYWIYTYFAGAVYDGNPYVKLKLAVISTLLIRELDIARYIETNGIFTKGDQIEICMKYSREIEHSEENLNCMEKMLQEKKLFDLGNLLEIIIEY